MFVKGCFVGFLGSKSVNAYFEEEDCATFIVLFYRPLPDSWRDFKTTTCPHFTPIPSSPSRPLPYSPLSRSPGQRQVRGSTVSLSPVFVSAMGKNRHLQHGRRLPPPFDLPFTSSGSSSARRQFCCHSTVPCCHSTAPSLSSLTGSCVCQGSASGYLDRLTTGSQIKPFETLKLNLVNFSVVWEFIT